MNPCVVTVDVFGEESSFEVSSHATAVKLTDVHQYEGKLRHMQSQSYVDQWYSPSIDSDIDHEVDYSFHETFGAPHGWL